MDGSIDGGQSSSGGSLRTNRAGNGDMLEDVVRTPRGRSRHEREYELLDTGAFADDRCTPSEQTTQRVSLQPGGLPQ